MPRHWFLKTKNGPSEPITSKTLIRLVTAGKIKPGSGVSADGENWFKAESISGLPFPKAPPKRYWVRTRGGDAGPFTLPKLAKLAAAGRIKPAVMVSSDGKRWKQAQQISGLTFPASPVAVAPKVKKQAPPERPKTADPTADQSEAVIASPVLEDIVSPALPAELPSPEPIAIAEPAEAHVPVSLPDPAPTAVEPDAATDTPVPDTVVASTPPADLPSPEPTAIAEPNVIPDPSAMLAEDPRPLSVTPRPVTPRPRITAAGFLREAEFVRRFGARGHVDRSDNSSVAVHVHPASAVRPATTIVTSGLSDRAMPSTGGSTSSRCELVLYADRPAPSYIELLHCIAETTIQAGSSIGYGSTYEHGSPLFGCGELNGCLFMIPNIPSDFAIRNAVSIEQNPLHMLWVVPTTSLERALIARQGVAVFCQWMDRFGHGLLIDPDRPCMVERARATIH
ncbi:Suppressor of fused protein (SUFU) [Rubripirellula tenax]|uniref:Suppressor of fused protein (SUFU) n=1 Tax=Rubripirellula tenax TaxID=2528015 RepID=A0A5C6FCF3_9BACT|nr:suppressor of fused domain protein [Rubripirellula tenax]TWU59393.1 Suppressor of fused protein (SUFU) [Rubripirellula tenax]